MPQLEEEGLRYDADERLVLSRHAIRSGLVLAVAFYGGLGAIVWVGVWVVRQVL
jgi:hypothetical protein